MRRFLDSVRPLFAPDGVGGGAPADPPVDPAAAPDPAAAAPPLDPAAPPQPDPAAPPPTDEIPLWLRKELNRKHATTQELKRERDALRQENEQLRALAEGRTRQPDPNAQPQPQPGPQGQAPQPRPAAPPVSAPGYQVNPQQQDEVLAVAQELVAQQNYVQGCNDAATKGKAAFADWDGALENIKTFGGIDQGDMVGILATDDPAKVLYELGKNPEKMAAIMAQPPARRVAEFVKIAIGPAVGPKQPPISGAPPPVTPVGGRPNQGDTTDIYAEVPEDEWYRRRLAQKRESIGRPWSLKRAS
jgi:hypothetical protein